MMRKDIAVKVLVVEECHIIPLNKPTQQDKCLKCGLYEACFVLAHILQLAQQLKNPLLVSPLDKSAAC
jgi:hypothetical protein